MLKILLADRTTGRNILWANAEFGAKEIQPAHIHLIKPRQNFHAVEVCKIQNDLIAAKR